MIPRETGLAPGKYRVRIYCADKGRPDVVPGVVGAPDPSGRAAPLKELIPACYNTESELTIEVESRSGNQFDFDLETKAAPRQ